MGLDIAEINNLMETVRPAFHQAIDFTIPDLHSAGQNGRGEILLGSNGCSAHEWALPNEAALQSHQHSHSHSLTQFVTGWQLHHHCRHRKADKGSVGRLWPIHIFRLSAINPIS